MDIAFFNVEGLALQDVIRSTDICGTRHLYRRVRVTDNEQTHTITFHTSSPSALTFSSLDIEEEYHL